MARIKVAFNGMGRIGKNVIRVITSLYNDAIEIVAGNDLVPAAEIAASLPKDSIHGRFPVDVKLTGDNVIQIGKHRVSIYSEKDASRIPWAGHEVDVVLECTGFYLSTEASRAHINAGAKKVIISAPCKDDTKTVVIGVNHDKLTATDTIISNASCTTNCLAPLTKAVDDGFGVISGLMCTTHAATSTQRVLDFFGGGKNRATLNNVIPASTGAAIAVGKVLPHLNGKLNGTALRVPTDTGSVTEVVYLLDGRFTKDEINSKVAENARRINASSISGKILEVSNHYECSRDCVGELWSSMFIPGNTQVVEAGPYTQVKMTSFYDNEMGYSGRMAELAQIFASA